jgi:hypothetical protein
MSQGSSQSHQPPDVDATEMLVRKRLEAELFSLDGQVRTFGRFRERLSAADKDPSAFYRQLQARREKLVAALKQPRSGSMPANLADPRLPVARLDEPLSARPISPARFNSRLGIFGFGSSGAVQVAPASEDTDVVAQGPFPHTGEIVTIPGSYPGSVSFSGHLTVGPDEIPPDQYDPTINYFWLRNWKYLIPFPPVSGLSRLTYRFDVDVLVSLHFSGGEGNVMSFVSLGETPNLTTGTNVTVDIDGGWPLMADLTQPDPQGYNGSYGFVQGQVTVQRSFMVAGGHVPGVAVIVGAIGALSMQSDVDLFFPGLGDSGIDILSQTGVGRVAYSYEPQLVAEQ